MSSNKKHQATTESCRHEPNYLEYLGMILAPNGANPIAGAVAQYQFHCKRCGYIVGKNIAVVRPYAADGTIFPEVTALIEKENLERAKAAAEQMALEAVKAGQQDAQMEKNAAEVADASL
jgi:hypothetical protein